MKTVNEILAETGLTYPMFNRLKDLGILPRAKRKGLGNRKGVIGTYEDEVIDIINWVTMQRKQGFSLSQIAEQWRSELAKIKVLKLEDDYLILVESEDIRSYLAGRPGFSTWLQEQVAQVAPDHEIVSVEMEIVNKEGKKFLSLKEVKVKSKNLPNKEEKQTG